jgi:sialate O-acetylesterase
MDKRTRIKEFPTLDAIIQENKDTSYINSVTKNLLAVAIKKQTDLGMMGSWFDPAYIPKDWRTLNIPGYWERPGR